MKILYSLNEIHSAGMEINAIRIANYLSNRDYSVFFLTFNRKGAGEKYLSKKVLVYRINKLRFSNSIVKIPKIAKLLFLLRPDIVHTRNLQGFDTLLAAKIARVPIIVHSEHGFDFFDLNPKFSRKYLRKIMFKLADILIVVSQNLKDFLFLKYNISLDKVLVIPNGVDLSKFRCSYDPPTDIVPIIDKFEFIIGIVARLDPVKNHMLLLKIFKKFSLVCQNSCLLVIGDGILRRHLEEKAKVLGIQNRVFFLGSRNDIPLIMPQFDVFVLPSLMEGMSNTILEAMASCIPVIASNVGGNRDLVINGLNGYLFDLTNDESLLNHLIEFYYNPNLRKKMGYQARKYVEMNHNIENMFQRYENLYKNLMGAR